MSQGFPITVEVSARFRLAWLVLRLHRLLGAERAWRWAEAIVRRSARYRIGGQQKWRRVYR